MYHRICANPKCTGDYCITPKRFEEDLKYFKKNGFTSVFASKLGEIDKTEKKIVVIAFDDGYKSDIEYAREDYELIKLKCEAYKQKKREINKKKFNYRNVS